MEIKIVEATVILTSATDLCYLNTELPQPLWPYEGSVVLRFEAPKDGGVRYLEDVIKCKNIKVIDSRVR